VQLPSTQGAPRRPSTNLQTSKSRLGRLAVELRNHLRTVILAVTAMNQLPCPPSCPIPGSEDRLSGQQPRYSVRQRTDAGLVRVLQ
jgi:hypothetical protein